MRVFNGKVLSIVLVMITIVSLCAFIRIYKPDFFRNYEKLTPQELNDLRIMNVINEINGKQVFLRQVQELVEKSYSPNEAATEVRIKNIGIGFVWWDFEKQAKPCMLDVNGKPANIVFEDNKLKYINCSRWP